MRRNNLFAKFIITLTLVTLLTIPVGRVTRVEAVSTTAAIAGAALIGTGAIYLGYLALTGGSVFIPSGTGQDIHDYLKDVGRKVAYYGSGAAIYNKLYSFLRSEGVPALDSYDVIWTQNDLLDLYNDFKDILTVQNIASFSASSDVLYPTNQFEYDATLQYAPTLLKYNSQIHTFDEWRSLGIEFFDLDGVNAIGTLIVSDPSYYQVYHISIGTYRNVLSNGRYYIDQYLDGVWTRKSSVPYCGYIVDHGSVRYLYPGSMSYNGSVVLAYQSSSSVQSLSVSGALYPYLPNTLIYNSETGEYIDTVEVVSGEVVTSPEYDDNENYPVVPYVQLPDGGNWGFNLGDLITEIINRGSQIITAVGIGDLINQFMNSLGGDTGDYIYYSDNDNNYYIYYSNVYQGDDYTTYNINVGDQQDVVPVDLNTIQQYTDNEYLDVVRERVDAFSDTVGSFVAFWHNTDYEIVYAVFGSALIVLLGAFVGKWGHS